MNSLKKKLAGRLEEYLSVVTQIFAGSATFCPPPCIRVAKMRRAPRKDVDKVFGWFQKQIWPFIIDGLAFFATLFCRTTHTATHLISEDVSANTTGIDIEFFQRVQVSTTDFVETTVSAFLAEVICWTHGSYTLLSFHICANIYWKFPSRLFSRSVAWWDSGLDWELFRHCKFWRTLFLLFSESLKKGKTHWHNHTTYVCLKQLED